MRLAAGERPGSPPSGRVEQHYREVDSKLRLLRSDVHLSGILVRDYLLDSARERALWPGGVSDSGRYANRETALISPEYLLSSSSRSRYATGNGGRRGRSCGRKSSAAPFPGRG